MLLAVVPALSRRAATHSRSVQWLLTACSPLVRLLPTVRQLSSIRNSISCSPRCRWAEGIFQLCPQTVVITRAPFSRAAALIVGGSTSMGNWATAPQQRQPRRKRSSGYPNHHSGRLQSTAVIQACTYLQECTIARGLSSARAKPCDPPAGKRRHSSFGGEKVGLRPR